MSSPNRTISIDPTWLPWAGVIATPLVLVGILFCLLSAWGPFEMFRVRDEDLLRAVLVVEGGFVFFCFPLFLGGQESSGASPRTILAGHLGKLFGALLLGFPLLLGAVRISGADYGFLLEGQLKVFLWGVPGCGMVPRGMGARRLYYFLLLLSVVVPPFVRFLSLQGGGGDLSWLHHMSPVWDLWSGGFSILQIAFLAGLSGLVCAIGLRRGMGRIDRGGPSA